ncbi:MAG: sodium:solute symporter [Acidobacteria bacterium]|nr:sodium:solute symporter [Acidobacteriota bacterium]
MSGLDWLVLVGSQALVVLYGVWKGRRATTLEGYMLSDRSMKWHIVLFSIMATQASAITFISTPGQAYVDGMRFVQFYLGLPVGMIVLSVTAVPIYHRLKVYTAYEYLEGRFDLKTRALAASLFLLQRGLSAGLTIFAPSLILSIILGWDLYITNVVMATLVILYVATGGSKALEKTNRLQLGVAMFGMITAVVVILMKLPPSLSLYDATVVAGKLGKMNAIDFSFDWNNRYNFWSGLIGGLFLQLSYFGTDQSQVGRYLTGSSVAESRIGLLFNGLLKIPMQFFILYVGIMVFVFFQFVAPPLFFNHVEVDKIAASPRAAEWKALEARHEAAHAARREKVEELVAASGNADTARAERAAAALREADEAFRGVRSDAVALMKENDPKAATTDTNYVFLTFVMRYLPSGLIGLVISAVFCAAMSSVASELNALSSTTVIDVYKRSIRPNESDGHYVRTSKVATVFWGLFALGFAMVAHRFAPSLIELVNIVGSLFYGTILGVFLVAFYLKHVRGTAVFAAAIVAEAAVVWCALGTKIAFLWYNVVGCVVVIVAALVIQAAMPRNAARLEN